MITRLCETFPAVGLESVGLELVETASNRGLETGESLETEDWKQPSKHSDVGPTSSGRHVHRQRVVIQFLMSGRRPADVND